MSDKKTITIFPHARLSEYGSLSREVFFEKISDISCRKDPQKIVILGNSGLIDNGELMDIFNRCSHKMPGLSIIFQDEPWMCYDSKYAQDRLAKILSRRSFTSKVCSITDPSRGAQIIDRNERTTTVLVKAFPDINFGQLADLDANLAYCFQENRTPDENKQEAYKNFYTKMYTDFSIFLDTILASGVENLVIMFDRAFSHIKYNDYNKFYRNYQVSVLEKATQYPKVKFLQLQSCYGNTTTETHVVRHAPKNLISSLIASRTTQAGNKYVPSFTSINV